MNHVYREEFDTFIDGVSAKKKICREALKMFVYNEIIIFSYGDE